MLRKEIIGSLIEDVQVDDNIVKTIVIQNTIWDGIVEVRVYLGDKRTFSTMFEGENKMMPFAEVPLQAQEAR